MASRTERIIASLLILAAFGLRVFRLDLQSIWSDEGQSIYWASQDLAAIPGLSVADIHPPLYYSLLHFWLLLAGNSEFSTRFFSLFFGVLSLAVLFQVGRLLLGCRVAALATLVAAASPFLGYYSQETRMYSLGLFFSLLSVAACLRWLRGAGSRAWLICYGVAAAASVYTHYYTWLLVAFLNIFVLLWLWASGRRALPRPAPWVTAQAAVGLAYLPWAGVLLNKYETYLTPASGTPVDAILYQILVSFGLSYSAGQAGVTPVQKDLFPDHWVVLSLALALLALAVWGVLSGGPLRGQKGLLDRAFVPLYLVLPIAGIILLSWGKGDFAPRHLLFAAPAYYLLIGRGMASLFSSRRAIGALALLLVLGVSGWSLRNYYFDPTYWRDDMRGMVQFITSHSRDGDAIILNAYYLRPTFMYYYQGEAPVVDLPAQLPTDWDEELSVLQETARQHERLWLVLWQDYYTDPQRRVQGWLDQEAILFRQRSFRGLIGVLGYLTRPPIAKGLPSGQSVGLQIGHTVELAGYQFPQGPICAGGEMPFTLYWRALRPLSLNYTVFVHLVDEQGRSWAQGDSQPLGGSFPTSRWPVGSFVVDERWMEIPADVPPGQYYLEVGMYDFATMKRLGGDNSGPSQQALGPFQVLPTRAKG